MSRAALALLAVLAGACSDRAPAPPSPPSPRTSPAAKNAAPPPAATSTASTGVLSPAHRFTCSPLSTVGCDGVFPVRHGSPPSEVALLRSGEDALRARVETLRGARRSIRIQALIFRADEVGLLLAELLKQKRAEGLDVRVIVDAASNLDWQTQWMYFDLKRHGVEVEGYEALYLEWFTAEVAPHDPLRANKRFHDKVWVVDAEDPTRALAIVGGMNLANEYFRIGTESLARWRDQDVLARGPVVDDVRAAFDRSYEFFKSIKASRPALLNPDNTWRLARGMLQKIRGVRAPTWRRPALLAQLDRVLAERPALTFRPVVARFLQSRPRVEESYLRQAYLDLIRGARATISIANAYFVPPRELTEALKDAVRRGVKVQIVTNSPETNDIAAVATMSRYGYAPLLAVNDEPVVRARGNALEILEWDGLRYGEGTLHAKLATFDGVRAIVGSYNLDPRSDRLNSETALVFEDERLVLALEAMFASEYVRRARPIMREEAESFRRPADLRGRFELLFAVPIEGWL